MKGFYGCIPRMMKTHGNLVLTLLAGAGFIATVILAVRETPDAMEACAEALEEKQEKWNNTFPWPDMDENATEEEIRRVKKDIAEKTEIYGECPMTLTFGERFRAAAPCYIPAALMGVASLGCLAGAYITSMRTQASLMAACAAAEQAFSSYRSEIREIYGEEADRKALAESRKKIAMLEAEKRKRKANPEREIFMLEGLDGYTFESTMADVESALYHINRNFILRGYTDMDELYKFLGIPIDGDSRIGWDCYRLEVDYGCFWIDFYIEDTVTPDKKEKAKIIRFYIPPWDMTVSDEEHPNCYYGDILQEESVPSGVQNVCHDERAVLD